MQVWVNGTERSLPENTTLAALLVTLGAPAAGVAVAVNRGVVPRSGYDETVLRDGDHVEVLRAVGGG